MTKKTIALVTGGNRGIGLEICRQLAHKGCTVLLGAREPAHGEAAALQLRAQSLDVHFIQLDQTQAESIDRAVQHVTKTFGQLDVLVNNGAILIDQNDHPSDMNLTKLRQTLETNVIGVIALTRALLPMSRKSGAGRIVNVSSGGGSLGGLLNGRGGLFAPAYQLSKTALNAFTVLLAIELKDTPIKVNSACPGWVRTAMGGSNATYSPEEGADTPVWLATLPPDGPTGGFFNSREPISW